MTKRYDEGYDEVACWPNVSWTLRNKRSEQRGSSYCECLAAAPLFCIVGGASLVCPCAASAVLGRSFSSIALLPSVAKSFCSVCKTSLDRWLAPGSDIKSLPPPWFARTARGMTKYDKGTTKCILFGDRCFLDLGISNHRTYHGRAGGMTKRYDEELSQECRARGMTKRYDEGI